MVGAAGPILNGYNPAYIGAGSIKGASVTYQINVGGVTVTHSNASPDDIGNAVANKTMEKLNAKGQYLLQSRTLTGGPNVV